jgi:hypothetical protein
VVVLIPEAHFSREVVQSTLILPVGIFVVLDDKIAFFLGNIVVVAAVVAVAVVVGEMAGI